MISMISVSCGGQGTTRVGNPESTKSKPTKNIYLDPLKDGTLTVRIGLNAFGSSEKDLKGARFDIILNKGEREFLQLSALEHYNKSTTFVVYTIENVNRNTTVDVITYKASGEKEIFTGQSSETEQQILEAQEIPEPEEDLAPQDPCFPSTETCDQSDNDCDGKVDEMNICMNIAIGSLHTCLIQQDRKTLCWGLGTNGMTAQGDFENKSYPSKIKNPENNPDLKFKKISTSIHHSCGLDTTNKIWCWGWNNEQQLAQDKTEFENSPIPLEISWSNNNKPQFLDITTGWWHSCGLDMTGQTWCWGHNDNGQLGNNSLEDSFIPVATHQNLLNNNGFLKFQKISAGWKHTCALDVQNQIWCWGRGHEGQLGFENPNRVFVPTKINHDPENTGQNLSFIDLEVRDETGCAIDHNHQLWCWGNSEFDQLGINRRPFSRLAVKIDHRPFNNNDPLLFKKVSPSTEHICGLSLNNKIWCWGNNVVGNLGNNSKVSSPVPQTIHSRNNLRFTHLSSGRYNNCALSFEGELWCWGPDYGGKLGNKDKGASIIPERIPIVINPPEEESLTCNLNDGNCSSNYTKLTATGGSICGLTQENQLWCWGSNSENQLGIASINYSILPRHLNSISELEPTPDFIDVSMGNLHTCAISDDNKGWCWGKGEYGQLANGESGDAGIQSEYPSQISAPANLGRDLSLTQISSGVFHSCGLDDENKIWCWGDNEYGQLGTRNNELANLPTKIDHDPLELGNELNFTAVSSGNYHSCGLDTENKIWCWGYNQSGQLGISNNDDTNQPTKINHDPQNTGNEIEFIYLNASRNHSCAIDFFNKAWCWGLNNSYQLGISEDLDESNLPIKIDHLPDGFQDEVSFQLIHSSYTNSCGIDLENRLWCWGKDENGKLGNGEISITRKLTQVENQPLGPEQIPLRFIDVKQGYNFSCAISTHNEVWCWGFDGQGQLGNTTFKNKYVPTRIYQAVQ